MNTIKLALSLLAAGTLLAPGAFAQSAAPNAAAPKSALSAASANKEVGIASHDGITVSGTDVLSTRNGVTDKVTKELQLPNGTLVEPDGTVKTSDGTKFTLRASQLLTFDGKLLDTTQPVAPTPPAAGTTTTVSSETVKTAPAGTQALDEGSAKAAEVEALRRANAAAAGAAPANASGK